MMCLIRSLKVESLCIQEDKYETVTVCLAGEGSGIVTYLSHFDFFMYLCMDSSLTHPHASLEAGVNPISRDGPDFFKTLRVTPLLKSF